MASDRRWDGQNLKDAIRDGIGFAVKCVRCGRAAIIAPEVAAQHVGPFFNIHRVETRLRCTVCDSRHAQLLFVSLEECRDRLGSIPAAPPPQGRHQRIVINTLGSIKAYGYELIAHCDGCHHRRTLDIDVLIGRLAPDFKITPQRLNPLMKCAKCGRKGAMVLLGTPWKAGQG